MTLESDNLTWLKGRAGAAGESVSELLDQLVTSARQHGGHAHTRSVVGTIEIALDDPRLDNADTALRAMIEASLKRPLVARERPPEYKTKRPQRARRGGTR